MIYGVIEWGEFPYREYYPNYPSPYWWEVFVNQIWGGVIALGFGVLCFFLGKWLGVRAAQDAKAEEQLPSLHEVYRFSAPHFEFVCNAADAISVN